MAVKQAVKKPFNFDVIAAFSLNMTIKKVNLLRLKYALLHRKIV
jgi:hypothetical protein